LDFSDWPMSRMIRLVKMAPRFSRRLTNKAKERTHPNLPAFGCIADLGLNFAPLWDQLAPQRALKLDVRGG
jgi:hypothetical protein